MIYIILIVIAIFIYLIYRRLKPKVISKEEAKEKIQEIIETREQEIFDKINKSRLKDYLDNEVFCFDCGKKNYIRLNERFKHDDIKFAQVTKDWLYYMDIINDFIYNSEMLDVCASGEDEIYFDAFKELHIKRQEIEKRYKELLGDDYIEPNNNKTQTLFNGKIEINNNKKNK